MVTLPVRLHSDAPGLRLSLPADARHLAWLRRCVRTFVQEHGSPPDVVDDLELVASELGTNVIRHTDSDTLGLRLTEADGRWILVVADADDLPDAPEVALPSPQAVGGRGLFIANELMDDVSIVSQGGRRVVRCIRSAHVRTDHASTDPGSDDVPR